jgi:molybdopterin/thiamine biosynthesis adenylyltransferase
MALSPDRLDRFARHMVLPEIGGAGQMALAKAHVVLVGLGGIGSPALQYLAGAGIGKLTLVDDRDIGHGKAVAAKRWAGNFDARLDIAISDLRVTRDNAPELVRGASLVLDGCDNFATRLAVSDSCVAEAIPLVSGAVGRFQGQVAAFAGHLDGHSCYRCFVGNAFDAEDCDSCAEDGMLGAMAGWAGTFAALQAIRVLLQGVSSLGDPQWGKLHLLDGLKPELRTMTIAKDPECRGCGRAP